MILPQRQSSPKPFEPTALAVLCVVCFFLTLTWTGDHRLLPAKPTLYTEIPKKIWYKLGPKGLSDEMREWTASCITNNPAYIPEFLTDDSGDAYVQKTFVSRPEIVNAFMDLKIPIVKADILRYLLLFAEGGVYFDLDVSCEGAPIDDWVPLQYKNDTGLVVGWEFDVGWQNGFLRQFTSWTIMAKPGLPHIMMVIEDIMQALRDKTLEHNVDIRDLTLAMIGDVVDFSGPRRLTESVLRSVGKTADSEDLWNLSAPKLVEDVLILPAYSLALTSNFYEDSNNVGPALLTHHFAGSWKNDFGGELI